MNRQQERDLDGLELILELAELITAYVSTVTFGSFVTDRDMRDLVAYRLSTIGETSRRLSPELKSRHSDIPWDAVYALRNVVAHAYRSVNPERVWKAAVEGLPALVIACRTEFQR